MQAFPGSHHLCEAWKLVPIICVRPGSWFLSSVYAQLGRYVSDLQNGDNKQLLDAIHALSAVCFRMGRFHMLIACDGGYGLAVAAARSPLTS
jgi:hypothetical protein